MSNASDHTDGASPAWVELEFDCNRDQAERLSDALIELDAPSVQVTDANADSEQEEAIFGEPGHLPAAAGWQESRLTILSPSEKQAVDWLEQACRQTKIAMPANWNIRVVDNQDWVRTTQAQFEPIAIGRHLWITPSWQLDQPAPEQRHTIVLDPGLAFGTGSHPTTRMCLQWLDENPPRNRTVVDYGCGSGILAIAAAKLGAAQVVAIDIDEQALTSAGQNALTNQVSLQLRSTRQAMPEPAAVVLANILAAPLKVLAPLLQGLVAPGGSLVLAGLLDEQADELISAYAGVELRTYASELGWTCLAGSAP